MTGIYTSVKSYASSRECGIENAKIIVRIKIKAHLDACTCVCFLLQPAVVEEVGVGGHGIDGETELLDCLG